MYVSKHTSSLGGSTWTAIVNCCMWVKMDGSIVRDCRMVFGNMGDHLITASQTMEAIVQKVIFLNLG